MRSRTQTALHGGVNVSGRRFCAPKIVGARKPEALINKNVGTELSVRFVTILACDGRTDGRTDGFIGDIVRACIAAVRKN